MSDSVPTIFGHPMHLQALPAPPMYVLILDGQDLAAAVWEQSPGVWGAVVSGMDHEIFSACESKEEAAREIERRITELVDALGPLCGWQKST